MRKFLFISIFFTGTLSAIAQPPVKMTVDKSNIPVADYNWQSLREGLANNSLNTVTIIDGEEILGIPFLYWDWQNGSISLASGRLVSKYMLRYDVYHQSVVFLNGKDSMEVSEEIKEFSLKFYAGNNPDSVQLFRFINGNQFKGNKYKSTIYYQLLYEDERGQLLKLNKKEIQSGNSETLVSSPTRIKKFVSEDSYFYYDKKKSALIRIKKNGSNLADILGLSKEKKEEISNSNFSEERYLLYIFKTTAPLKAF